MKERLGNNELFYWKISPFHLLAVTIVGAQCGWSGAVGASAGFCIWNGVCTLVSGVMAELRERR
jgi:hypothetical protein